MAEGRIHKVEHVTAKHMQYDIVAGDLHKFEVHPLEAKTRMYKGKVNELQSYSPSFHHHHHHRQIRLVMTE